MSWKVHLTSCFFIAINLLKLFLFPWKNKGQKWEGRKTVSFIFECNFPSGERKRDLIREAFFTPGRECEAETKGRRTGRTKVIKTFLKGWKCCAFMGTEIWPFLLTCTINTLRHNAPLPYTWCLAPINSELVFSVTRRTLFFFRYRSAGQKHHGFNYDRKFVDSPKYARICDD